MIGTLVVRRRLRRRRQYRRLYQHARIGSGLPRAPFLVDEMSLLSTVAVAVAGDMSFLRSS